MTATLLLLVGVGCTCGALLTALGRSRSVAAVQARAAAAPDVALAMAVEKTNKKLEALEAPEVFAKLYALALRCGELRQGLPPGHEAVAAGVAAAIESSATQSRYALRRPLLLPQLLHALKDTETSRRELSTIITQDPALVGSLLKLANSAVYRTTSRPIESVDRAIAVLGTEGIRSLVVAALVQPVFRARIGAFAAFPGTAWEHTFRAASAAEAHAAFVEKTDRFAAQLLGLLMGLGAIVVFRIVLDRYAAFPGLRPEPAVVVAALEAHTAVAARRIAADWELSSRILEALDGEAPGGASLEPTALGRSLRFGRLTGALAVLRSNELVDDAIAFASLPVNGAAAADVKRIWTHLAGAR